MKPLVTMIDYGIGNLFSVTRALEHVGASVATTDSPHVLDRAERVILPGVGSFANGMSGLRERSLIEPLRRYAASGRPFLGICLGLQLMFDASEEFGRHEGLGLIAGEVKAVPDRRADGQPHKIPHVGWAPLAPPSPGSSWDGTLFGDVAPGESVYFVHSFTAVPADERHRLADTDYDGCRISAAVRRDNLYGCQFHPEKSGPTGLRILARFVHAGCQ